MKLSFSFLPIAVLQMTNVSIGEVTAWPISRILKRSKNSKKNGPPPPPGPGPQPPGPSQCDLDLAKCDADKKECDAALEVCNRSNDAPIPTAPLLSEVTIQPIELTEVGCDNIGQYRCDETKWVYCIDAACSLPDENGLSTCNCIKQPPSKSILPKNAASGATCVANQDPAQKAAIKQITGVDTSNLYGEELCDMMKKEDVYISTLGALTESPNVIPPFADQPCPAETTPFTYCWGASCTQNPSDVERRGPNAVQCLCPYVQSPEVNIQIETSQCTPEQDGAGICNYLHNGNPSNLTNVIADVLPGLDLDVVPTCDNYVPAVNLNSIGCAGHDPITTTSRWVYCIDAYCAPPVDGFSDCYCWIQEASESIGPGSPNAGASCVRRYLDNDEETPPVTGESLAEAMAEGELYSTFGSLFGANGFVPPMKLGLCPPLNPFPYCWGAKCQPDPRDPENRAICRCPNVVSNEASIVGVAADRCPEQGGNVCNFNHNGGPRDWEEFNEFAQLFSDSVTCEGPCEVIFPIGQPASSDDIKCNV